MTQTKHEPTPYILCGCSGRMISTPSGYVGDGFIADVDTLANAKFIVKACNCHDELLEALELAKETIKALHGTAAWEIYNTHSPEMKKINAAIKAARG